MQTESTPTDRRDTSNDAKPVRVTVDNFSRAESDLYFARLVERGGLGKLQHERELADIDDQTVIRMNRDTLYSSGVFDLDAGPVTVTLPDPGTRYLSVQIIDEDHFVPEVLYAPATRTLTKEEIGTRYVGLVVRTFVNPNDASDLQAARALQDAIQVEQKATGTFEAPKWDQESQNKIRETLLALSAASGGIDSARMFGRRGEVDPVQHLIGSAAAWGGNPARDALYVGFEPKENDGQTPYQLTVRDVPVDGFWSVSVYNKEGFFVKNARNLYTVNNVTARPNADGSVTIHFGGDENAPNYIPIMPGWNYLVRLYRPRKEILDGAWQFPEAQPMPSQPGNYPARYQGGEVTLATAPNGAVVYDKVLEAGSKIFYMEETVIKVADGLWTIGGVSFVNAHVIEGPDGLIVYDCGDSLKEGKRFCEIIEAKISKKPIKALIYSHSHYALGGPAMVDDPSSVMIIGHPKLEETIKSNLLSGGAPAAIPELGPVLTARAAVQFNNFLPKEGPDAPLGATIVVGEKVGFLPPTKTVEDGEIVDVAGVKMQFFTKHLSDDYSLTVLIPQKNAVLNNFFWAGTINLYTLRGDVYRDPQNFINGLKLIRDLQPEHLLSTHGRTVSGKQEVLETLNNYMDLIALTYDQTLRGILRGLGPDDLRYFIYKPGHLAEPAYNSEIYGETSFYPPAIFYYQMGWYDRDVTRIYKLPPRDEAERLVALMGGKARVLEEAQKALTKKEYAWAAQLVNYVYILDPTDRSACQIKADAVRKLGQLAFGSIPRAFLLSEARALEGEVRIPALIPPAPEIIANDPAQYVNYHRVRIDPRKAEKVDQVVTFTFGDKTVGLHVRRGVAEFLPEPGKYARPADVALELDGPTWARLYLNQSELAAEIKAGNVKLAKGDAAAAEQVLGLFDTFDPALNWTMPRFHEQ